MQQPHTRYVGHWTLTRGTAWQTSKLKARTVHVTVWVNIVATPRTAVLPQHHYTNVLHSLVRQTRHTITATDKAHSPQHFETRQAKYVHRNTETRKGNHYCTGKATSITYSECVFAALGTQHEMRMRHIVIGGLFVSTLLFHIFS